jgi:hypothetical protein
MGMITRLNDKGDTPLAVWDETDEISVEEARQVFARLVADPSVGLAELDTKNTGTKVTEFNPQAERIVVWSQFAGG